MKKTVSKLQYCLCVFIQVICISMIASEVLAGFTVKTGDTFRMMANSTFFVDGDVVIEPGATFDSSAANTTVHLTGDWKNSGAFISGTSSTIGFIGTGNQNILGVSSFHNVTATTDDAGASRTLGTEKDQIQTIQGAAVIRGAAGRVLNLRTVNSSGAELNDGSTSTVDFQGSETTEYLDVRDQTATSSNASVGLAINPPNSVNSGNTTDWFDNTQLDLRLTVADQNGGQVLNGDILTYTLTLNNPGTADSTNTILENIIPGGLTYIAGSTTLNGSNVSDVSGQSPLVNGLAVNSDGDSSGTIGAGDTLTVTFQAQVDASVPKGTSIFVQADVQSDQIAIEYSDDPNLDSNGNSVATDENDATIIVVGEAPLLHSRMKVEDLNGGSVEIGDQLRYTTVITNRGNIPATNLTFLSPIGVNTTYVASSITVNSSAQTDAGSDDSADYNVTNSGSVTAVQSTLNASAQMIVAYLVTVDATTSDGTVLSAQGTVDSNETIKMVTDGDDNIKNGLQETNIIVGAEPNLVIETTVLDLNGGEILPGDTLKYHVRVANTGMVSANAVVVENSIASPRTYVVSSIVLDGVSQTDAGSDDSSDYDVTTTGNVTSNLGTMTAGQSRLVEFNVTVDAGAASGANMANTVNVTSSNAASVSETSNISVGGQPGVGVVQGNVFLDIDQDDTVETGEELEGWNVHVRSCSSGDAEMTGPIYETVTDSNGFYTLSNLPAPGEYTVQVFNPTDEFIGDIDPNLCQTINEGENIIDHDLPIDPSGFIYDSVTGDPLAGAVVTLIDSSGGHGTAGDPVPNSDLVGSNTVTTDATGFYSFFFNGGAIPAGGNLYEIRVTPPAGYILSTTNPPVTTDTTVGLLDIASGEIDAPAAGGGNVDDKSTAPFNVVGPNGAQYRYAFFVRYGTGEIGEVFQNNIPLDPGDSSSIRLNKTVNKSEAQVGSILTYTVTLENTTSSNLAGIQVVDDIPGGFKYISGKTILDGVKISDPSGTDRLTFDVGTISANTTHILRYQLVVGAGVSFGDYLNTAYAVSSGTLVSNVGRASVEIVPDAIFDLGTIIGKVFNDKNANGFQDEGELGIVHAKIVMEDGTKITTDKNGLYSVPGVSSGRHVLRLDERSLPKGTKIISRKAVIEDVTRGLPVKINFAVQLPIDKEQQSSVLIEQSDKQVEKQLNVSIFHESPEKQIFRIFTNYHLFVDSWRIEIFDLGTKRVVKKFSGGRDVIFNDIHWNARDDQGLLLNGDAKYAYRVVVSDSKGREDQSLSQSLDMNLIKVDQFTLFEIDFDEELTDEEVELKLEKYLEWQQTESRVNRLEVQRISIEGGTVRIKARQVEQAGNVVIKGGDRIHATVPMVVKSGLTAQDLLESPGLIGDIAHDYQIEDAPSAQIEMIVPNGDYEIVTPDGSLETIQVGDDYLFFVAMGDAIVGYTSGDELENVAVGDRFDGGFWHESKMAYFVQGKVKGKYLIESSYDSDRQQKELFKNLDPDEFYPVYGDDSTIDYDSADTQGNLYAKVSWDKSEVKWGNFNTEFEDSDLTGFNRTLYGAKAHLESKDTTKFGDSKYKIVAFAADANQKSAHNEFLGTGGSLFFLKHKDVIQGSERVKIEVRDQNTGLVLSTEDYQEPFDYVIDYNSGRIVLSRPLSMVSQSNTLISSSLLEGHPVYLVVDYEYEVNENFEETSVGAQVKKSINDHVIVGGIYVKEEQVTSDYTLIGTDVKTYIGDNMTLTTEYAESESVSGSNFISRDGGLSFAELSASDSSRGEAYGTEFEGYFLNNRLGVKANYQYIDAGFSSPGSASQQGKEIISLEAVYDFDSQTRLTASHDIQTIIDGGNQQTALQVGAQKTQTTTLNASRTLDKYKITGEYRRQEVEQSESNLSETNQEEDAIAARVDYRLTDRVDVYAEQQLTLSTAGEDNHQTTVGMISEVKDWLQVRAEQKVGNQGGASSVGATANVKDKLRISGDYTVLTDADGNRTSTFGANTGLNDSISHLDVTSDVGASEGGTTDATTISGSYDLDEKTEVHGSFAVNGITAGEESTYFSLGTRREIDDKTIVSVDRNMAFSDEQEVKGNRIGWEKQRDENKRLAFAYTDQVTTSQTDEAVTQLFEVAGDIDEKWAGGLSYERGNVQNFDGAESKRNAVAMQVVYLNKDEETGESILKSSHRFEYRLDEGENDIQQFFIESLVEGKLTDDLTVFAEMQWSETENKTLETTDAMYKEFTTGLAYRPLRHDWMNLLAKYSYIEDDAPVSQLDASDVDHEKFQALSGEAIFELTRKIELTEKIAFKWGEETVSGFDATRTRTWLWINRLRYNFSDQWNLIMEYRILSQKQADDSQQGAVFELRRNIGDHIQVGLGYNMTRFNDDIRDINQSQHGPYVRVTGTLFDKTLEQKREKRQKTLKKKVRRWVLDIVKRDLDEADFENDLIREAAIERISQDIWAQIKIEEWIEDRLDQAKGYKSKRMKQEEMDEYRAISELMQDIQTYVSSTSNAGTYQFDRSMKGYVIKLEKIRKKVRKKLKSVSF